MPCRPLFAAAWTAVWVCLAASVTTARAAEATIARGVVFDDADRDGVRGEGEPGLPGVKVSNGEQVVITDAAGRYALPVDDDTILFVIKPPDWMTPVNELNLPRFFYVHKPAGSPDADFVFKGVAPTGPVPASVDFPLHRRPEDRAFKAVMIGDPQPYNLQEVRWYADDTLAELRGTDAAFVVALGDLVGDDLDLFEPLNRVQAELGVPVYNVYGNHDMNFMSPTDEHADETYERVYGPATYAFEYADVCFVVLDNVLWKGFDGYRDDGRPKTGNYEGHLTPRQLSFLRNYVATVPADRRVVLLTHIPLVDPQSVQHSTPQAPDALRILADHPYTLSFSGHTHVNHHFFVGEDFGYPWPGGHHHHNVATGSGSWYRGPLDEFGVPLTTMRDGVPNGYAVVGFDGASDYRIRFKGSRRPADEQMSIHAPGAVSAADPGPAEVVVNVFNGSERSVTELRVVGVTDWTTLERFSGVDPTYVALRERSLTTSGDRRPLPEPRVTHHLWRGPLPAGLPAGQYTLEVRTTDMFGRVDRATRAWTVEAPDATRP
jgi:hypothetical protein